MQYKLPKFSRLVKGRFEYQRRVPKDLVEFVRKTHWRVYLGTKDLFEAETKIRQIASQHDMLIKAFRRLSKEDKEKIILEGGLETFEEKTQQLEEFLSIVKFVTEEEDVLENDYESDELVRMVDKQRRLKIAREQIERDLGESQNLIDKAKPQSVPAGDTVLGFFDEWRRLKPVSDEYAAKMKTTIRWFAQAEGNRKLADVKKKHIRNFANKCESLPNINYLSPKERALPFPQLVKQGRRLGVPLVSHTTMRKQIDHLRGYFAVALSEDLIEYNPTSGLKIYDKRKSLAEKQDKQRWPMNGEQIKVFLDNIYQDQDRLIAKICTFQGCRLEEAGQLAKADFRAVEGVWCMKIHDRGDNKVKNIDSLREIPVHPKLENDLKKWISKIKRKDGRLFPKLPKRHGRRSHLVSKRLNELIRKKITEDKRIVVHSLRHSFIDACRATGMPDSIRYRLGGHSDREANKIAEGYGEGHSAKEMYKWLKKINPLTLR